MTRSLCYTHEALTSLAPHERLPELPVIPRSVFTFIFPLALQPTSSQNRACWGPKGNGCCLALQMQFRSEQSSKLCSLALSSAALGVTLPCSLFPDPHHHQPLSPQPFQEDTRFPGTIWKKPSQLLTTLSLLVGSFSLGSCGECLSLMDTPCGRQT